ncbi:MAG: DUF6056 family protein [Staphylococcus epidermidis]|nr:DUF6056 family protein [Staphylococcus epidermidis]MCT6858974.1 DUF6056 family protein [Apilactobacillus sp.]
MKRISKKINVILSILLISITFICMYLWNYLTPLWNDDEGASHMSLKQIYDLGIHDYFAWNGRLVGQTIFRFLVNIPTPIEALLNSIVFIILSWLILFIAKQKIKQNAIDYLFILLILFGCISDFTQIFIWRAGSGNYLWTMSLDLLLLFLIKKNIYFNSNFKNIVYITFLSILGLIVGQTNENTVGGIIILYIFYIFFNKLSIKKYIYPLITTIIGYASLILAPGEWKRAEIQFSDFLKLSFFQKIQYNFKPFIVSLYHNEKYVIVLFLILFIVNLIFIRSYKDILESVVWFISGLLVLSVLILSAGGPSEPRTHLGGFILISVASVILFCSNNKNKLCSGINIFIIAILLIGTAYQLQRGVVDSYKTNVAINKRNNYIIEEIKKRKKEIIVPPLEYYGKTKYSILYDHTEITDNPTFWANQCTEHYFKFGSIILKNK